MKLLITTLCLVFIVSCTPPTPESPLKSQPTNTPQAATSTTPELTGIDIVLNIPSDFKPEYKVEETKDVNAPGASRITRNIILPDGLDKATLELNFKHAAKELYLSNKPDALMIFGYRKNDSRNAPNTVGSLTFAPYGDWGKASEKPSIENYKAVVDIKESYMHKR